VSRASAAAALLALVALPAGAQQPAAWEPLFLGFGTEPEMDYAGRTVASLQSLLSRSIGRIGRVGERHPGVAPAWEFPAATAMLLLQHEVAGHGGRARESGLSPSYSFALLDFSAATYTARAPDTHEENALLAAGGVESDQLLARRVLLDLLRPEGADGAKVPLAFMAKLDLTRYVSRVDDPEREPTIVDQYRAGNDMAFYLISRQATRRGADPAAVWNGTYEPDFADPLLGSTHEALLATAAWNLLDPSLVGAVVAYFRQHVLDGSVRVRAPVVRVGDRLGLTLGTRGALGPQSVSRFLDLYGATPRGVFTAYVRDLDSSIDRTLGVGVGVHALKLGRGVELGVAADAWDEPRSREAPHAGSGWNATAEIDAMLAARWGVAAKLGAKSVGFFPGLPREEGPYVALGLRAAW
jgi:hypothetical protein